jgi:hypothetical protein
MNDTAKDAHEIGLKALEDRFEEHLRAFDKARGNTIDILKLLTQRQNRTDVLIRELWEKVAHLEETLFPGTVADIDRIFELTGSHQIDEATIELDNRKRSPIKDDKPG